MIVCAGEESDVKSCKNIISPQGKIHLSIYHR